MPVIVVAEPVEDGPPSRPAAAKATCMGCGGWVWLGAEATAVVQHGQAIPMCQPCAGDRLENGSMLLGVVDAASPGRDSNPQPSD